MTDTTHIYKISSMRLICLMVLLPYGLLAYPVYGTKRYGRSSIYQNGWMHVPSYYFQALPRPHTYHAPTYYEIMNPYAPDYDDYYYQDPITYPLGYYPSFSRNADMYQPVVPYSYYYSPSYYDGADPIDDVQEEMLQQEQEREQREEALPIGQETWYESDPHDDSIDDVNAAFMKNLMLYNDAMSNSKYEYGKGRQIDAYDSGYGDMNVWNEEDLDDDDEDVQELKNLNENLKKVGNTKEERMQMFQKSNRNTKINRYQPNNSENWLNYGNKRTNKQNKYYKANQLYGTQDLTFSSRKPQGAVPVSTSTSTVSPVTVTADNFNVVTPGRDSHGGQKEVVMMRPATPVRRPFSEPVMKLLAKQGGPERKRTPSVYDTIKHMLEMEKSLEKENQGLDYYRSPMKKRYVSSEESLVEELSGLKKTA